MTTTKRTRTTKAKKPVFPIRPLSLLIQKFHLLVIDGEAFLIKGKEHKHIKCTEYEALLDLAWITAPRVITEGLHSHEVTPLGHSIAAQMEEQKSRYHQLQFSMEVSEEAGDDEAAEQIHTTQQEQPATTHKGGKRPHYQSEEAKAERAAKRATVQKNMQQAVSDLLAEINAGKSERLLSYLKFSGKFHQYSPLNQMLIAQQVPDATRVAGYSTWKKLGYQVRKGEKGIAILAPRPYEKLIRRDDETGEETTVGYLGVTFRVAYVFDASQLEPNPNKPMPAFFTPLADDQEQLFRIITQAIRQDGITLEIGATGQAQGYSVGGKIRLKADLDSTNRVLTLIHEWAHEKLHQNPAARLLPTGKKECHAEAISYVVSHHFGIHNPFSSDYLQNWGNNEKELLAELETIKTTASAIIEQIEAEQKGD